MLATSDTAVGSAGIQTTGGHLTISGTGRLYAISRVGGAGIGGGSTGLLGGAGLAFGEDGGTIVINSGTVRAVAYGGAGIGGGSGFISGGTGGNIYIHGGTIIAQNYRGGAGIGGGAGAGGSGGNITITGGTITATGGTVQPGAPLQGGAGIGGGWGGSGGNINISGGTINTTGGNYAAGIGGGWGGGGGTVNVSGGIVNSTGGRDAASIGGGIGGAGVDMTISGGLVQIGIGQWVEGSVDVQGGNFSIHDPDLVTNIHHGGDSAFRIQITLQHANGSSVPFGPHMPVTYTVNGMTINAITDSDGNLFMYLPEDFSGNVQMTFDGRTFRGQLVVDPDHGNQLVLTRDYEDGGFIGTRPNPNGRTLHFQVGPNSGHSLFLNIEAMDARTLGLVDERGFSIINVSQDAGASISQQLQILDSALSHVSREWAMLGAMQNRLDFIARGLDVVNENLSDANSRILNADMAMETGRLARANFRHQASITVLAQANQASDRALWLLQDPQPQALN
ncbi:MAG: hypothetical protein FWC89_01260 [Defluviitaleaceae bacterium]|nr:hypothetical protein [Defluviitaleaceae bacterium]